MPAPQSRGTPFSERGLMFWLPPHGFGNGRSATAWAELADLDEYEIATVLFDLAAAGIGGYVAEVHYGPGTGRFRLWVDTMHYRHAEDLMMRILATMRGQRPPKTR